MKLPFRKDKTRLNRVKFESISFFFFSDARGSRHSRYVTEPEREIRGTRVSGDDVEGVNKGRFEGKRERLKKAEAGSVGRCFQMVGREGSAFICSCPAVDSLLFFTVYPRYRSPRSRLLDLRSSYPKPNKSR